MSLLLGAGLRSTKNKERGSFESECLMLNMLVTVCPNFSISDWMSDGFMEKYMFLRTTLYEHSSFGLKVRKDVFLSARALIIALYVSGGLGLIFTWLWARALISYSWKAI
jgi:hypothetical protein